MKINVYTFCYNEEVVIPFAIDYWKRFANHVYVFDNMSTDHSRFLLSQYDFITIYDRHTENSINNYTMRDLKNSCWKHDDADFVVVCDMDEFLYSPDIMREFETMKQNNYTVCKPRYYYNTICETIPIHGNGLYHTQCDGGTTVLPKTLIIDPKQITDINYSIGSHCAYPKGNVSYYRDNNFYAFHANNSLSLDYKIQRYAMLNNRRREYEKEKLLSMHYGKSEYELQQRWNKELERAYKNKYMINNL